MFSGQRKMEFFFLHFQLIKAEEIFTRLLCAISLKVNTTATLLVSMDMSAHLKAFYQLYDCIVDAFSSKAVLEMLLQGSQ